MGLMDTLKTLLGIAPKADFGQMIENGATIVDVRSKGEFAGGHLQRSVNIPLDALGSQLERLDKTQPIITCCASGMRSAAARRILLANGFSEVYNGGSWASLRQYE